MPGFFFILFVDKAAMIIKGFPNLKGALVKRVIDNYNRFISANIF